MRILAIRHGQSMGNVNRELYRTIKDHRIELTSIGHEQAYECGKSLRTFLQGNEFALISSPYKRTIQTTEGIIRGLGVGIDYSVEPLIREQEWKIFGPTDNYDEYQNEMREFGEFYFRMRNGESMADVNQRAAVFLNHLRLERHKLPDTVVLVSHAIFISALIGSLKKLEIEEIEKLRIDNCEIVDLDLRHNPYKANLIRKAS